MGIHLSVDQLKPVLELSALVLTLVNALILMYLFLRDRPKTTVDFVHPEVYNWFFRLPAGEYEGQKTNRFGFLLYLSFKNRGLRPVAVDSWRLQVKLQNRKKEPLKPLNIPYPEWKLADGSLKRYPVLGQYMGTHDKVDLYIKSGDTIAGFAYYELETYGEKWLPIIITDCIRVRVICTNVFNKKFSKEILVREKSLDQVEKMVPNISKITTAPTI